jgi:hypothetical protein
MKYVDPSKLGSSKALEGWTILLSNVYFTRLWIVQEVLLAQEIHIMVRWNIWADWSTMSNLYAYHRLYSYSGRAARLQDSEYARGLLHVSNQGRSRRDIAYNIDFFCINECENSLNNIYGLLGLVDSSTHIIPDYTKSVQDVYTGVLTAVCLEYVQRLTFVSSTSFCNSMQVLSRRILQGGIEEETISRLFDDFDMAKQHKKPVSVLVGFGPWKGQPSDNTSLQKAVRRRRNRLWLEMDGTRAYY